MAIWEHASDQTFEPEDGMLGVAVVMPDADGTSLSEDGGHFLVWKYVTSGQPVRYSFGSCWSNGDTKTPQDWFQLVTEQ